MQVPQVGRAGDGVTLAIVGQQGRFPAEPIQHAEQGAEAGPLQIAFDEKGRGRQGFRGIQRALRHIPLPSLREGADGGLSRLHPTRQLSDRNPFLGRGPVEGRQLERADEVGVSVGRDYCGDAAAVRRGVQDVVGPVAVPEEGETLALDPARGRRRVGDALKRRGELGARPASLRRVREADHEHRETPAGDHRRIVLK